MIVVPGGPSPKNSGSVLVTTSPSSKLSKVTVSAEGVAISSGTSNPDDGVASSGRLISALGTPPISLGDKFLKSWLCPRIMGRAGFAEAG